MKLFPLSTLLMDPMERQRPVQFDIISVVGMTGTLQERTASETTVRDFSSELAPEVIPETGSAVMQ